MKPVSFESLIGENLLQSFWLGEICGDERDEAPVQLKKKRAKWSVAVPANMRSLDN